MGGQGKSGRSSFVEDSDLKQVPKNAVAYEVFGALFFGGANNFLNVINDETKMFSSLRMRKQFQPWISQA